MQTTSDKPSTKQTTSLFQPTTGSNLLLRLTQQIRGAAGAFGQAPAAYLRMALFPDRAADWLPVRLSRRLGEAGSSLLRRPFKFVSNAKSRNTLLAGYIYPPAGTAAAFAANVRTPRTKPAGPNYKWVWAASGALHGALVVLLVYVAVASRFFGWHVVNDPNYPKPDPNEITRVLVYPPGYIQSQIRMKPKPLDQVLAEEQKRREQARLKRAKEAREKAERERAEQAKAAGDEAAGELTDKGITAQKDETKPPSGQFGAINVAPIKDMLGKIHDLYKAGALDLKDSNFSVMAGFKIERNGSLSHIRLLQSSGSKTIDNNAIELLNMIGESHALAPLSNLSSDTIRLDLTPVLARLTITGFAPTSSAAKDEASTLNDALALWRFAQKAKSADNAELLSLLRVRSDNNRVDADLSVSRSRAAEMWRSKFGNSE